MLKVQAEGDISRTAIAGQSCMFQSVGFGEEINSLEGKEIFHFPLPPPDVSSLAPSPALQNHIQTKCEITISAISS